MASYPFDTNHASALWRNLAPLPQRITASVGHQFSLCLPSIAELWFMVHNSARVQQNEGRLRPFLADFTHVPFDAPAAVEFGRFKAHLRRIGRPMPDVDIQIASIAMAHDLTLLTGDAHFASLPQVRTENWL
jgi:tRNA(fMet)-specific endonuclease VapC